MSLRRLLTTLSLLVSVLAATAGQTPLSGWQLQDISHVTENGETLSRPDYAPKSWYRATVPGTVLTSLVEDGVYPEPLYGENNRAIPESLCRTSYWYRTTFNAPRHEGGRHVWLNFDGINYGAVIWVNGTHVGDMTGAFCRGNFDVTRALGSGGTAAVAVKITPPPHPGKPLEQTVAAGTGPNGGAIGADGPTFVASVGWDWIPGIRDRDMGIWQRVSVSTTGPVTVRDSYVTSSLPLPRTDSADLTVQATLSNLTDRPVSGVLEGRIQGTSLSVSVPVVVASGPEQIVRLPVLHLARPRLWWPNGYGAQNLYSLHVAFREGRRESDAKTVSFGVRTIDYFPADRSGPNAKNLTLIVNGVPVFAKGGNWGMDEAMKRSPRSRLEAQMRLHRDANYTMIRNWVGMATQEDFYDLCDKYGIMVWDDFWLANPADGPVPQDFDLFLSNAREKIVRFRNHPSIAVWCGRNEAMPPAKINAGLQTMVADLDGKRFYQPHSASLNGVGGGGPYSYRKPADYFTFRDAFHTEVGGPSIPTLEAIETMMPRKDWWPINDDWAEHDLCRGAQRGDVYPQVLSARFGTVRGLEDFVRKAQLANYESYRAIYEGREEKAFDPATGVLIWMSNPAQPSFVWQLYSYDLEPTAALFAARKGGEPIHVQLDSRDSRVYVVNNTGRPLGVVSVGARIYDLGGSLVKSQEGGVSVGASEAKPGLTLDLADPRIKDVYFVRLEARDARGRVLSDNFYWSSRSTAENGNSPNDFTSLQTLPPVTLEAQATGEDRGRGETRVTVELHNPSSSIALMTHLQLRRGTSDERVLPVFYSDNYVSLVGGERRRITVDFATADLHGQPPKIVVDGWNVRVKLLDSNSESIVVETNSAAIPRG